MILNLPAEQLIFYALIAVIVLLIIWIIRLEIKLDKLCQGKNSQTIDDSLKFLKQQIDVLQKYRQASEKYLTVVDHKLKRNVGGIETVRFNPFKGTGSGGNQSFATAFVNENGEGVVLSSLYSREHVSIFSKPITEFSSSFELTAEEKQAVKRASEKLKN